MVAWKYQLASLFTGEYTQTSYKMASLYATSLRSFRNGRVYHGSQHYMSHGWFRG